MGTIIERRRANGSMGYSARIVVQRAGVVHRETQTFDRRAAATAWIKRREHELSEPGGIPQAKITDPTLGEAIDRYVAESRKESGPTKAQVLRTIRSQPVAELRCSELTPAEIGAWMRWMGEGRDASTVGNYASHLATVLETARRGWGWPVPAEAMKDAAFIARRMGVISASKRRDRLPTLEELDRLMEHFGAVRARRPDSVPMQRIVAFAIFSTRRQEEIIRITWADLDASHSRVMVRDMKHPGQKAGNDQWCELPPEAMAIVKAMPRQDPRIFPYTTDAVGAAFTKACKLLGIVDLHFHDLRHAGASRLFEMGRTIPQVAGVTGHRSWSSLQRYTHIKATGDRFAGWSWLKVVAEPMS
jgi:integrase